MMLFRSTAAAAAALALSGAILGGVYGDAARAEVQKFMNLCGNQQICASYQLVLTPPDGWALDKDASAKTKVQILVPKGKTFATAEPLIYVQVFYHRDKQETLGDFARTSNARWTEANPSAKISDLPAVDRTNGKPGFLRFAFQNPKKPQQAYEVGAFGVDADKDGNEYVLDVVMSASSKQALDRAETDYVAFLKAN
ncbi:MAG TPA: hypothetical protein VHU22_22395 [Xanthobacteraceae bacterium]|jgi:hypothetical protein|nr:hypothetical protein [Xanthobacteraceae bacterium]